MDGETNSTGGNIAVTTKLRPEDKIALDRLADTLVKTGRIEKSNSMYQVAKWAILFAIEMHEAGQLEQFLED